MAKITLQGIAYDGKSSFMKGPAKAPPIIRHHYRSDSSNYFAENGTEISPEIFDDKGDYEPIEYFDIEDITSGNINNYSSIITLGGDHSITYPVVKAIHKIHGPVDILHIDAHSDLYDSFEGDRYSHACPFARIMEEGLARRLVQVGIRTLSDHQRAQAKKFGVEIIPMADFKPNSIPDFNAPLYISLDLDALDPAYAPGISHYEPGGFSSRQVINIINGINTKVIGADIVEYNPDRDINGITAMLSAKLLKEISAKMLEIP